MKRVVKKTDSEILRNNIEYKVGGDNSQLSQLLFQEQKGFCAYTETYLGRTDKKEIDHFNPKKEFVDRNKYHNLFLVKGQWNNEKSAKWDDYQPILHPTDEKLEERIIYFDGDYILNDETDNKAKNFICLLKLDDPDLASERKRYIKRKKDDIKSYGVDAITFFSDLINADINNIHFLRAIDEEFGIDIKSLLP